MRQLKKKVTGYIVPTILRKYTVNMEFYPRVIKG